MEESVAKKERFNICMCCDFFYPRLGGVEMHIFQLSLELIRLGHKVIIVTNTYGNRQGVRYITNGLKVYYTPMTPFVDQAIFPQIWGFLPLFRKILIRENIQIVHTHQTTSVLGLESILHSRTMGYKTVFTDHSLFGFSDAACIHVNKLLKFFLSDIGKILIFILTACTYQLIPKDYIENIFQIINILTFIMKIQVNMINPSFSYLNAIRDQQFLKMFKLVNLKYLDMIKGFIRYFKMKKLKFQRN